MHILIINGTPHNVQDSNTAMVTEAFAKGIISTDTIVEKYHLSIYSQKEKAKNSFFDSDCVVIALPVFAATIPAYLMSFFQEIYKDDRFTYDIFSKKRKISFIIQSGFPEACQRRCCEKALEQVAKGLNCIFSGALSYGINHRFLDNEDLEEILASYERMGREFIENDGTFFFDNAINFTGPEHIDSAEGKRFSKMFNFFCRHISEAKGNILPLDFTPYTNNDN